MSGQPAMNVRLGIKRDSNRVLSDRRHGIASAHFMCPSKASDVAMAR